MSELFQTAGTACARVLAFAALAAAMRGEAATRPESGAFPFKTPVVEGGTYDAGDEVGVDFVVTGDISSALSFSGNEPYRVTLSDATVTKTISLSGDAQLWLVGESAVETDATIAISSTGSLTIGGPGSVSLASAPTKKQTGPVVAEDLVVAGGATTITLNADVKNAAGITLAGDYVQLAGTVAIDCASYGAANKVNGILVNKKNKTVTIEGGTLSIAVAGEKSVGISLDKAGTTMLLSGGAVELDVGGAGAKGVKGDESFTMTGGLLAASVTGGVLYENYEDSDGSNYVVKVTSTSLLSSTGSYVVQDTSPAYAVKCGNISISGGTVRVAASGTASRGLCADADGGTFDISGGFFDITCNGDASDTILEMLDESALTTDIDKATACALRTSESNSVFTITGGTLNLVANGDGGKCIVAKGELVIGVSGQITTPSDSVFLPDVQAATYGEQTYVAAKKQKNYLSVGTATIADLSSTAYYFASNKIVSATGDNVDYSNPKCIKAEGNLTMHGGRIRGFSQAEGGEGFESKAVMTINGGIFEATTYDDCINASESLVVNGGYLYCGATNNDAIDSNGSGSDSIVINGGVVLCFTAATPEIGIDTDNSSGLKINGGTVVSFGSAAGNMVIGSTGSLATYKNTSVTASTYAGKYLKMTGGDRTVFVKVPSISSSSASVSLVCTTDGCSSAPSVSAVSSASGTDSGFHGVWFQ